MPLDKKRTARVLEYFYSFPITRDESKAFRKFLGRLEVFLRNNKDYDIYEVGRILRLQLMPKTWMECPECSKRMYISPVNTGPRDRVGGGYMSAVQCSDSINCGYEVYLRKDIKKAQLSLLKHDIKHLEEIENGGSKE